MKTNKEKIEEIKGVYSVGDELQAGITIHSIGSKYVTCVSIWGILHTVKYTIDEFYDNFMVY